MTLIDKDICKLLTMKSSDMNNSVHLKSILTVSEVLIKYKELSVVLSPVLRDKLPVSDILTVKLINMMSYLKTVGKIKTLLDVADLS